MQMVPSVPPSSSTTELRIQRMSSPISSSPTRRDLSAASWRSSTAPSSLCGGDFDAELQERLLRSFLLGGLLRLARPFAELVAVDDRRATKAAVVRRPVDIEHGVVDGLAAPRKRLLQLRLEVDVAGQRVVDPAGEGPHDRLLDRPEAVLEEQRGERCLEQRREDVAVVREAVQLVVWDLGAALLEALTERELPRDDRAARPRDDVRADLREPSLAEVRVALVQFARDRELEDAVPEELEPLVRRRAVGRPGRVRVDLLCPRVGQPFDQLRA